MSAAIDFANIASLTATFGAGPFTFNVTCAPTDNFLPVLVGCDQISAAAPPTGITYNGVALTLIGSLNYTNNYRGNVSAWCIANPPTGLALPLSATFANSNTGLGICAAPMSGVNTTLLPTFVGNSATSAAAAVALSGAGLNDMQLATCFIRGTSLASGSAPQAHLIAPINGINGDGYAADYIPGTNVGSFNWTLTSGDWLALGITVFGFVPPTEYSLAGNEYF